ncbi:diguanylate cyclase [Methylomonas koyamae]|uniref:cyclic-guanylate-specific phosphodiesterase n=1 Tax=Methylomonas koyamae TaxID=702114 RepID=A0A177NMH4_9GAMM|nr:diguanylate cyclase [Methylomonas koyamae]
MKKLWQLLFGNLRKQLILGMTLIVALMMATFIWDMTRRQEIAEMEQNALQATALSNSLATSSAVWVLSRDYSGLQEIVQSTSAYPAVLYAIVVDLGGHILAHNDKSKIGMYLSDLPSSSAAPELRQTVGTIDVLSPIILGKKQVGWVRIGLDRRPFNARLTKIKRNGLLYILVSIGISALLVTLASRFLTRRLYAIQKVADAVQFGRPDVRVELSGNDEAAKLARQFNGMLDSLNQREQQLRSFYELNLVGLTIISPEKDWIRINDCLCRMLEYSEAELRDMTWAQLTHSDDLAADEAQFNRMLANEIDGYSLEKRFISRSGKSVPVQLVVGCVRKPDRSVDYVTAMVQDITEHKHFESEIRNLAFYDPLTNLPNRRMLSDRLKQAIVSCARNGKVAALLFLDLDNFKALNDTLGHATGDLLLQQVAQRLSAAVRECDTVARLGGDEFVVMLENLSAYPMEAIKHAQLIANKIMTTLNQSYQLDQHTYNNTPSIGVVLFDGSEQLSHDDLLKQADIAMYQAKKAGRNSIRCFDPRMQESINNRVALEADLQHAIDTGQFILHYQSQLDHCGNIIGAEALIRWQHAQGHLLLPSEFIELAEETGLILPIGQWVIDTACRVIMSWQHCESKKHLVLSVNVSAKQFQQTEFVSAVKAAVQKHGINPERLKLELTESMLLSDIGETIAKMKALREIGVRFSLDDFGTGFSSLQYLKRLPLDQLKIDKSFVRDIAEDANDRAIIRTIIAMAHTLKLDVIAEGVETAMQRQLLIDYGCNHFQGYLFSKPQPIEQFDAQLQKN